MIPKECKRLAEVDFPIAEVSRHAAREKSIRHGHPSTLHLWWARRPLAPCRAILLALLWPDPCDPCCPADFKQKARELLPSVQGAPGPTDEDLRKVLLQFIADFANWDLAAHPKYLEVSRALVRAAYPEEPPLVVDPFAGGGSIPLEALRVGCDAFANDLNPIPALICRVLLEDAPKFRSSLNSALNQAVTRLNTYLSDRLASLYPQATADEEPTAYLWARTVYCEAPDCGAEIPLLRSLWLSRHGRSRSALKISVQRSPGEVPEVVLTIHEPDADERVGTGTVIGGRAICPACSIPLSRPAIESQLRLRNGGTDSARLIAVMVATPHGRLFRMPVASDLEALKRAQELDAFLRKSQCEDGLSLYPDEHINPVRPSPNARGLSAVTRYGMTTFSDCYLPRQRAVLAHFVTFVRDYDSCRPDLDGAIGRCLLILLGRCVDRWSSSCRLDSSRDTVTGSFSKQALQLVWDFCEANPFSKWSGGLANAVEWVFKAIDHAASGLSRSGQAHQGDASELPLPDQSAAIWFTDPPYYDSVPYADLADFFFCWLRRASPNSSVFRDPFDKSNPLTPKTQECVWNQSHLVNGEPKDSTFFERCVSTAFGQGKRIVDKNGTGCVVFAHKSTEGWEALLNGLVRAGLSITSSWPIQTEMKARTAARDAASLMGSVHLVCRPRPENAPAGDWADVLRELPKRVGDWMERLESEGVRGADLVFACIGPALEIFSRYARVETADGREVSLAEYLEKVWEVVGRTALEQVLGTAEARARNGAAGAVEEDARLTALFLWTLQSTNGDFAASVESEEDEAADDEEEEGAAPKAGKGYSLVFDVVRRFAQPLGINLPKWENRIIETRKGVVRLLAVSERARLLFGQDGREAVADLLEKDPLAATRQLALFPDEDVRPAKADARRRRIAVDMAGDAPAAQPEATTLDRVHAAMLLQAGGRTNALRALLKAEQERGPYFLRLANALSALYPKGSEEKRLLDAMLLVVPR